MVGLVLVLIYFILMYRNLHSLDSVWDWLWSAFVYTAMVNYPTEANFMKPLPAYPVKEVRLAVAVIWSDMHKIRCI